eukprot:Skav231605  [mRNA]  locus=scaffold232:487137:491081:+ [translate_table: standard]
MQLIPWDAQIIVSVSSPCPPWCTTSEKDGLLHEDGMLLPRVIFALRFINPTAIAFENVHAICQHRHFPVILGLLKWSGFSFSWQKISDLNSVAPVSRKRWLAVFTRTVDSKPHFNGFDLPGLPFLSLASYRVMIPLPDLHEHALTLDRDLVGIYGDQLLVKQFGKKKANKNMISGASVLKSRCKKTCESLATTMAMYGEQHKLPRSHLQKYGLFTELFEGRYGPRFFSPIELAILHGVTLKFAVPVSGHDGHKAVGNCIAVPQAVQALAALRRIVDDKCSSHPTEAVMQCLQLRLHSGNATIQVRGGTLWLLPNDRVKQHLFDIRGQPTHHPELVPLVQDFQDGAGEQRDTTDQVDIQVSPTLPFRVDVSLHVEGLLGCHVIQIPPGTDVATGLSSSGLTLCPDMCVVQDGVLVPHDLILWHDAHVVIGYVAEHVLRLLKHGATWYILQPGMFVRQVLKGLPKSHRSTPFRCCTLGGEVLSPDWFAVERTPVLLLPDAFHIDNTWKCYFNHEQSVTAICRHILRVVPEVFASAAQVCIRAFDNAAFKTSKKHACELINNLCGLFHQLQWSWTYVDESPVVGYLAPLNDDAAPTFVVQYLLLRGVITGFLNELAGKSFDCIQVRFEFQDTLLWQGKLPLWTQVDLLTRALSVMLTQSGFGNTIWTCQDMTPEPADMLVHLKRADSPVCIRALPASPLRLQGGGKMDVWKECKNMLGKEMITRGWQIVDLDATTTEWLRAIGCHSPEKRWTALVDSAKWAGLQTTPNDPIKMRAIRTIQKAVRKKPPVKLDECDYRISPGFFTDTAGADLPILDVLDLGHSGVFLCAWEDALQWITKQLPLVPDELAILTLLRESLPDDVGAPDTVTFPALDKFGRRVVLKGHLWQLGEKKVLTSHRNHDVAMPNTTVVACTLWRDECSPEQWENATRNLVRTAFTFLESAEPSKCVIQVWGRSYRDAKSRVEPAAALSGQFHMRVFTSKVEDLLRLSGKSCVYLTPKDENHLSHPLWGLVWLKDKAEAEIAASRASDQSGLARTHAKFALRVRAASLEAVAAEVKPSSKVPAFPVVHLFKVQPFPAEMLQDQVIEWAEKLGWRVKVLKRLGQSAYLLGAATKPPHDHMSLNGSLILIKEVHNGKREVKPTAFVAGPKPPVKGKSESSASSQLTPDDPWATYLEQQGRSVAATKVVAPQPATNKAIEGPIQAKFAALEQRLQTFEADLSQVRNESKQVVNAVTQSSQRLTHVEEHIQAMQSQMSTAIEKAMSKGMREQERRLDAQFASIMQALNGDGGTQQKRTNEEVDDDDDFNMETPTRQPAKK